LLVVVAVIAILAALLLPALSQARAGRAGRCAGTIFTSLAWQRRCIGRITRVARSPTRARYTNGGDIYWFGWIERYRTGNEGRRAFDATQGALFPYFGGRGVEICPSLNYGSRWFKYKATGAAYGYGMNLHLSEFAIRGFGVPVMSCCSRMRRQINTFQEPASTDNPLIEEFYYVSGIRRSAPRISGTRVRRTPSFATGMSSGRRRCRERSIPVCPRRMWAGWRRSYYSRRHGVRASKGGGVGFCRGATNRS
jgi:hypothetical protein